MWKIVIPGTGIYNPPTWLNKQFNLCAPGGLQARETVAEPFCSREGMPVMQIKNCWSTDKEVLGKCSCSATVIQSTFFQTPYPPFLLLIKSLVWNEMLRQFLRVYHPSLLRSPAIWVKYPYKFNPFFLLVFVMTGSTNADFSGFNKRASTSSFFRKRRQYQWGNEKVSLKGR